MKKRFFLVLFLCSMLIITPKVFATESDKWDGSSVDTSWYSETEELTIDSAAEFAGFAKLVNNGEDFTYKVDSTTIVQTVKLTVDIDLDNNEWTPIGRNQSSSDRMFFCGIFDGGNHTVSNLCILKNPDDTSDRKLGLFGAINSNSNGNVCIKNLKVTNVSINGFAWLGAIVGYSEGAATLYNCHVNGDIYISGYQYIGGIIGRGSGGGGRYQITNCTVKGTSANRATIKHPQNTNYGWMYAGGIIGWLEGGTNLIDSCTVEYLDIISDGNVGSITGLCSAGNTISNCIASNITVTDVYTSYRPYTVGLIAGGCNGVQNNKSIFKNNTVTNVVASVSGTEVKALYGKDSDGNGITAVTNIVAQIGSTGYETFEVAVRVAKESKEPLILMCNIDTNESVLIVESNETLKLELNGCIISSSYVPYTILVEKCGTLTITGRGTISNSNAESFTICNYGTLVIGNTDVDNASSPTITCVTTANDITNSALNNKEDGTLIIYSGIFDFIQSWGSTNVYGGMFKQSIKAFELTDNNKTYESKINIDEGIFDGVVTVGGTSSSDGAMVPIDNNAEIIILGGSYATKPNSDYIIDGYTSIQNSSNYWIIVLDEPAKFITDINEKSIGVGVPMEFTLNLIANRDMGVTAKRIIDFSDAKAIEKLECYDASIDTWHELSGDFDSVEDFSMSDITNKFRVTFNTAGYYTFTAKMLKSTDNSEVCNTEVDFTVYSYTAKIGEDYYITLAEAVAAVRKGETITLLKTPEENDIAFVSKTVSFSVQYDTTTDISFTFSNEIIARY